MNIGLTLLGQSITFAVLVWFTMKYVWPPITQAMEERQKKIADGLAAAERAEQDLEQAQAEADLALRDARNQAAEIVAMANKRGDDIIAEKTDQARVESERVVASAQAQIEQEAASAKEALRAQLATLTVTAAGKVLSKEIDADVHSQLLDELAAQI